VTSGTGSWGRNPTVAAQRASQKTYPPLSHPPPHALSLSPIHSATSGTGSWARNPTVAARRASQNHHDATGEFFLLFSRATSTAISLKNSQKPPL